MMDYPIDFFLNIYCSLIIFVQMFIVDIFRRTHANFSFYFIFCESVFFFCGWAVVVVVVVGLVVVVVVAVVVNDLIQIPRSAGGGADRRRRGGERMAVLAESHTHTRTFLFSSCLSNAQRCLHWSHVTAGPYCNSAFVHLISKCFAS